MSGPKTVRVKAPECNWGGSCGDAPTEWRFVPFVTCSGGLVACYCPTHVKDADSMGGKPVASNYLPRLEVTK